MHSSKHNFIDSFLSFFKEIIKRPAGIIVIFLVSALVSVFFFLFPITSKRPKESLLMVRVRIARNEKSVKVGLNDKFKIEDIASSKILKDGISPEGEFSILSSPEGITLKGETFKSQALRFTAYSKGGVMVNDIPYRGSLKIIKTKTGLNVVNIVELEDYLKGVIPCEVNPLWPFAALKAQAIASRSFTVYQALRRKNREYDLTADTYSQVYKGKLKESRRTNKAVNDTQGLVLSYKGKVLPGYFHSCCGGHTEDASKIWDHDLKPLRGVRCKWCRWSPYYKWSTRINKDDLAKSLNRAGYEFKRVTAIKEGARDKSGRLEFVTVEDGRNKKRIDIARFRGIVGRSVLKSANFYIGKFFRPFSIKGYGWGHGVGMCQWGAFGLAIRWKSAERILKFYYPGAEIVDLGRVLRNK